MADTEVTTPGDHSGTGGDTEIDLYADVVENELDTVRNALILESKKVLSLLFGRGQEMIMELMTSHSTRYLTMLICTMM